MPVVLSATASNCPETWDYHCTIGDTATPGSASPPPDLARALEQAFDEVRNDWTTIARHIGRSPDSTLAHMPACCSNISDFGLMLAWSRLVERWGQEQSMIWVTCRDPWLFRHLASLPGCRSVGQVPRLWPTRWRLALRGLLSRLKVSASVALAALNRPPSAGSTKQPWILVYGHPSSTPDGQDAYFGDLMRRIPTLRRALHVDCPPSRARRLEADGRTVSLHRFGSPMFALTLWRKRWRPPTKGPLHWLVLRAGDIEGGSGTPAMIAWQQHCQHRWLRSTTPQAVTWPWENHSWERVLVRQCTVLGVKTIGYQHATVGWREWNYSPASNPDGDASLPERIHCVGASDRRRLIAYGCPSERLAIAGGLRFAADAIPSWDVTAPVFVALPFDSAVATEMMEAVYDCARSGLRFVVRDHPLSPYEFTQTSCVCRAQTGLSGQDRVAAVLYCITTVGLEAVLAGLPTLRFVPSTRPVVDVMPDGIAIPSATGPELAEALSHITPPPPLSREQVFAAVAYPLWAEALCAS